MAENDIFKLIEQSIELVQKKNMNELVDNNIKTKTASVITYDKESRITIISLVENRNNNEYKLYNKSGEELNENDLVKVYYTTNVAKGWIGARLGEPVVKEIIPYISSTVKNVADSELGTLDEAVFDLDFEVLGTDSDSVLNVNQILTSKGDGLIEYTYEVDGEAQEYRPKTVIHTGKNIIPHIVPMTLDVGTHKVAIKMKSADATGDTYQGDMWGVISGQIGKVNEVIPFNSKMIFYVDISNDGDELIAPGVARQDSASNGVSGTVNWGDGTIEEIEDLSKNFSHTYINAGSYKITISALTHDWRGISGWQGNDVWRSSIKKIVCPDNLYYYAINVSDSTIESVYFGDCLLGIGMLNNQGCFQNCANLKSIAFPNTVQSIYTYITNTGITSLFIPESCKELYVGTFSGNTSLTTVKAYGNCEIKKTCFAGCSSLTSLDIKNHTGIGENAFRNCKSLKSVNIPLSIVGIGIYSFMDCVNLSELTFDMGDGEPMMIYYNAFSNTSLKSVTLPDRVTYYRSAFPSDCVVTGGTPFG